MVTDCIGAGDSCTATLCVSLLKGWSLAAVSDHANRVASYVCSQKGAVPAFPENLKEEK